MKTNITKAIKCVNYLKGKNDILVERGVKVEESNPEGCLLFIGINPSFKNGDLMPSSPEYKSTYPWDIPDEKTHSYFIKSKRFIYLTAIMTYFLFERRTKKSLRRCSILTAKVHLSQKTIITVLSKSPFLGVKRLFANAIPKSS